jgi:CRP-like cAMP-binding protein
VRPLLERLAPIPEREWRHVVRKLRLERLAKGEALTRAGEVADRFGFVASGLVRKLHVTEKGRSVVRGFGGPGDIVGAYASLLTGTPSHLSVEALAPSELFVLDWAELGALYERHVCWQILGRRMAEHFLLEREQRAHELLTLSARERYEAFCRTHRPLLPALRNYDIASYLGITPVSLSRLRASRR